MRRLFLVILNTLLAYSAQAWGWNHEGHALIGAAAEQLLANSRAATEIQRLLPIPLSEAAKWADCARNVHLVQGVLTYQRGSQPTSPCHQLEQWADFEPGVIDYVRRNWVQCGDGVPEHPCHTRYHYTDVAIQHIQYRSGLVGTSDHDIVGVLGAAIAVLQERAPNGVRVSIRDKSEALLLIAHLVGDLHQPLHVGAIYLDGGNAMLDPDRRPELFDPATMTNGGNLITTVGSANLHGEWDGIPAGLSALSIDPAFLHHANAVPLTSGRMDEWPVMWAGESVSAAEQVFDGMGFTRQPGHPKWDAQFDNRAGYQAYAEQTKRWQLAKAAARLNQLLRAIWPD